jgi:murein DD-endopeptidase MepM/ murein hydrolase activator NlpD
MRRAISIILAGMLLGAIASASAAPGGGVFASPPGVIGSVACADSCSALTLARPGSTIRILGTGLDEVQSVVFLGARAGGDEVSVPATVINPTEVTVIVPPGAVGGHLQTVNADGNPSVPSHQVLAISAAPQAFTGTVQASVSASRIYFDGTNPATLSYFVDSASDSTVTVALVHGKHGSVVASWGPIALAPGVVGQVTWSGAKATGTGAVAASGSYSFDVSVASSGSRTVAGPQATSTFAFLPDVFPVQGAHTFNMSSGRFGAQRTGHIHEGQDVMADCGTPLVAARGGTVEKVGVDANAGNYVVIDAAGTGVDMVYAHLRHPSPLQEGGAVLSGQSIGVVGRTGDATACHLHFEEWTAPGWYKGGHPYDPLPDLRAWDKQSRAAKR